MQKKILINGAGRGCQNLIKTAKKMGLYTVVTGMEGPCHEFADVSYRDVHPGHPEEVYEVAKKEKVNGVATSCNDMGIESVGYCCDKLGLCGLSQQAAQISSNKLLMKRLLVENNVRTAKFIEVGNKEELLEKVKCLQFPVIVKATDLQGSRGISIVRDPQKLLEAFSDTMSLTHKDYCIVEEFIEGVEFGAQAFVYNGEVLFVLPHGDETIMCKTAVPIGHYMPYEMTPEFEEDVRNQAILAIKACGLNNCAVNMDFIEKDGKAYIIELTGRGGANGLTDITGRYFGINYYEMILKVALGEDPRTVFAQRANIPFAAQSKMIKSKRIGIIKSMEVPSIENVEINMFVKPGDEIRPFTNCNDAIGEIFVKCKDLDECEELIERLTNQIHIELQ